MPNCRRGLLAVLNIYVLTTVHVAKFVTNHYVTDNTLQSIAASALKLP